ncbi:hypothetical protein ACHAPA_008557 [Fusarium lateritium]
MVTLRSSTRQKAKHSSGVVSPNNIHSSTWETVKHSSWDFLPQDIRRLILEIVSRQKGWGSATSVCKEWHYFIATKNFGRLELNQSNVQGLSTIIRQRSLIRYIYLNVELPTYRCQPRECWFWGTHEKTPTVRNSLRKLFSVLRTWGPDCCITLELNANSLSEQSHWFKNHLFGFDHEDEVKFAEDLKLVHDPKHGWEHGKQVLAPRTLYVGHLFRPFLHDGLSCPSYTSKVPAIKKLIIRRQMRRRIPPAVLQGLLKRLSHLENITYEPWHVFSRSQRDSQDKGIAEILRRLPKSVKSITIFEDFNEQIMKAVRYDRGSHVWMLSGDRDTRRVPSLPARELAEEFASRSLDLEHLSVSFMINFRDFDMGNDHGVIWPRLRSLMLTTPIMIEGSHEEINDHIFSAALMAETMPRLETLAIWHCSGRKACAVIFRRNQGPMARWSTLTWRGTEELEFSNGVIETWQRVIGDQTLLLYYEKIDGRDIDSHGDAIHYLQLPEGVIDPRSLAQIRKEGKLQKETWAVSPQDEDE